MKEDTYRYRIIYRRLASSGGTDRKAEMASLAESYVRVLEEVVRRYPHQWFNWYDFWEN
jgi:predicted LPLAT superfamily acyltransferase